MLDSLLRGVMRWVRGRELVFTPCAHAADLVAHPFHQDVIASSRDFEREGEIFDRGIIRRTLTLGRDLWNDDYATLLDGVTIGEGCVIGADTVIISSVVPPSVVVGVPGRVIKSR